MTCLRVVKSIGSKKVALLPLFSFALVLGGASSGKSDFAESLCFQSGKPKVYIATAQAFDDEMREKIQLHRELRGPDWLTIEAPLGVGNALAERSVNEIVLLDCATLWLSNVLLAEHDTAAASQTLLSALAACPAQVIVVSNEVGHGIVPDNQLARRFRSAQGQLNQKFATQADLVVHVMAGLPNALKGSLT